jgi:uncharacterized caspase-like protein
MRRAALLIAVLLFPVVVQAQDYGDYHALVIGNNAYQHLVPLLTPRNDARGVKNLLESRYGFAVKVLLDATRYEILDAFSHYRQRMTANDNLLIYYAGHGWLDEAGDEGYWLPVDAKEKSKANWISNAAITTELRAIAAKHVMIVADSCFSGKLGRGISAVDRTPGYIERLSRKKARVLLAAGGLEPVVDTGGGDHSIFAAAFMSSLAANNGVFEAQQLFSEVRKRVGWNARQIPEYGPIFNSGHDGGDFIFVQLSE